MEPLAYLIRESWKENNEYELFDPGKSGKVSIGGIKLYYKVTGEGEPLVLIMGFGGDHRAWYFQTRTLRKHYQVITFDNRGAGKSDKPEGPYNIREMAGDTIGLMDYLGIGKSHILGVSMGGMIAQEIAVNYPGRVKKLILASTTTGMMDVIGEDGENKEGIHLEDMLKAVGIEEKLLPEEIRELDLRKLDMKGVMKYLTSVGFNKKCFKMLLAPAAGMYAKMVGYKGIAGQLGAVINYISPDRLQTINAPTLVITGTEDRCIPHRSSDLLAERIPKAKLVKVGDGSHSLFMEMRKRFNKEVLDFLRSED